MPGLDRGLKVNTQVLGWRHMGLYNNPACLRYVRSLLRERLACKTIKSKKRDKVQFCSGR